MIENQGETMTDEEAESAAADAEEEAAEAAAE